MKLGIVVADFNDDITSKMVKAAQAYADKNNATIEAVAHVPGAFELPFKAKQLLEQKNIEGVVVLGVIIQGKTDHDITIANAIAPKLIDLSLEYNKPVGFGVIGPRVSREHAKERAVDYAERAVQVCLSLGKG